MKRDLKILAIIKMTPFLSFQGGILARPNMLPVPTTVDDVIARVPKVRRGRGHWSLQQGKMGQFLIRRAFSVLTLLFATFGFGV